MVSPLTSTRRELQLRNADALFVSNPLNIYYLTGFRGLAPDEREVSLLVTADAAFLHIPRMYEQSARILDAVTSGGIQLVIESERDHLMYSFIEELPRRAVIFFEGNNLLVQELREIEKRVVHLNGEVRDAEGLVENLRIIKNDDEVENIKKAVHITDETYNELVALLKSTDYTRLSELDVVDKLRVISRNLGGEGFSFDPVVAVGAGSAEPHYFTGNTRLNRGELLLIDFGIKYHGYCGDLTRCLSLGPASEEMKKMYALVLKSNERGIAACRPGVAEGEVFDASNAVFKEVGLDRHFLHGLGHGIGLGAHEDPYLRSGGKSILRSRMAVTIEPGLYIASKFGIRIEDYVILTEDGCELLSDRSPKAALEEI